MAAAITFNTSAAISSVESYTKAEIARFKSAITRVANFLAVDLKRQGDADIAGAGNFGSRWTSAFNVQSRREDFGVTIEMSFRGIPYAMIHETGGVIHGKPLLWIPLSFAHVNVPARAYPGRLFRVNRAGGRPLLFSAEDRSPKYVGVPLVRIPKRFHLREIAERETQTKTGPLFFRFLKGSSA